MLRVFAIALSLLLFAAGADAASKTYQVTGPVLEVKDDSIVVQKGNEKWEIARDASTKVTGDLKVGAKVTVEYRMSATNVSVKADKADKAEKKDAKKK